MNCAAGIDPVPLRESAEQWLRADCSALASALHISLPEARREVQMLLTRAGQVDLASLLAHPERAVQAHATSAYAQTLARRLGGEPMAYVLGEREFYGLVFEISPAVLIPRPETELLVELALQRLAAQSAATVLDLGTGSGCIAVTLAKLRPAARIIATDLSSEALIVAQSNARRHGVTNIAFRAGSWFDAVAGERFDLIVSNPPYVARGDAHLLQGDLRFEPAVALTAGPSGLEALHAIASDAPRYLAAGGSLLVEHGLGQGEAVAQLLRSAGLVDLIARNDLAGIARAAAGRRP
jgi:release factor glutamine methyltransferase